MKRALLVEDHADVRVVLELALARLGYDVVAVEDGHAALAQLCEAAFVLVVTDLRLSGPSGIDIAQKALDLDPAPAVLVVSGYLTDEDERRLEELGASTLRKPFKNDVLAAAISSALARSPKSEV